jgi:HD-GYP domain-containing protein (c-di-GMP phosphodiesterase class II)
MEEVDQYALDLVLQDSKTFDRSVIDRINFPDPENINKLQRKVDNLLERHYSLVEIYDLNQAHVAIAERELDSKFNHIIELRHHFFPLDKKLHFEKIVIDNAVFLQVLVPLKNSEDKTAGYMEAVYQVEDEVLTAINRHIYRNLIMVVVIILACIVVLYPVILNLNRRIFKFSKNMLHANLELMDVLGNAIAVRDETTNSHNYRVALYATRIGEALNLNRQDMRSLIAGSFLHDVGKIGIRDAVLRKPHELNETEVEHMRGHVLLGLTIIGNTEWLTGASDVIEFHHEKFDGSGYLRGLKGEEIPLIARIFSIVDVFDALTTQRPYKKAFSFNESIEAIKTKSGSHFDPRLVKLFLNIAEDIFAELSKANHATLEALLTEAIDNYFFDKEIF